LNNYPVEPAMADWLKQNLEKYYPNEEYIDELYNLITSYGMYICCDKIKDFEVTEEQKNRLIELLLKLCLSISAKPTLYEDEYYHMKKYWYPDWEICYGCSKRYTSKCDSSKCNPMDI
jgi:hypothetical protein